MALFIIIIALIFRLILINQSFWLDEAASLSMASLPLSGLFSALGNDFHPPLYYLILHFWLQLGIHAEWFLRLPNVIFGVATVWFLYRLVNLLKPTNTKLAAASALLLALNPLHIYYSQELRMYSLNVLLSLLSWYLLLQFSKKNPQLLESWQLKIGFMVISTLNIYLFYGAFFNLFAQFIYLLISQKKLLKSYLILTIFSIILFLPWLPTLKLQLAGGQYLQNHLPEWSALSGNLNLKSLLLLPLKFSLGRLNLSTSQVYLVVGLATSFYFSSIIAFSLRDRRSTPLVIWLLTPVLLAMIISLQTPILGYWRYLYLLPPFSTLLALGIFQLPPGLRKVNLAVIVVTLVLANLSFWLSVPSQREDWRGALQFASNLNQADTVSIFAFSDAFAPVKWYAPDLNYSAPLKDFSTDPAKLDLALSQATLNRRQVLFFNYLSPLTDPTANISTWLDNAGFQLTATHNFTGVGFVYQYSPL